MSLENNQIVQIGDCTLYLGDCLDILPTLGNVDAVVTDPPYGIEEIVGGYGRKKHKIANDKNLDACHAALNSIGETQDNLRVLAFYSCKVTGAFLNGIGGGLTYFGDIVWDKCIPGLGANFRYQHENIAIFTKGQPPAIGKGFSVLRHARNPDLHPHQKPIPLMCELINISGGSVLLDPFMGSGSTGVACVKMGRKFIGIEIDPDYFEIACRRIRNAYSQPQLFIPTPVRVEQLRLF